LDTTGYEFSDAALRILGEYYALLRDPEVKNEMA